MKLRDIVLSTYIALVGCVTPSDTKPQDIKKPQPEHACWACEDFSEAYAPFLSNGTIEARCKTHGTTAVKGYVAASVDGMMVFDHWAVNMGISQANARNASELYLVPGHGKQQKTHDTLHEPLHIGYASEGAWKAHVCAFTLFEDERGLTVGLTYFPRMSSAIDDATLRRYEDHVKNNPGDAVPILIIK